LVFIAGIAGLGYHVFRFITPEKQNNLNLIEKGGGESTGKKAGKLR